MGVVPARTLPACGSCRRWSWPENTHTCRHCGNAIEPTEVEPTGTLLSTVLVHAGVAPVHLTEGPYSVAAIRLDAGPIFITRLLTEPTDLPSPDTRVRLVWRIAPTGQPWPFAQPSEPDEQSLTS